MAREMIFLDHGKIRDGTGKLCIALYKAINPVLTNQPVGNG